MTKKAEFLVILYLYLFVLLKPLYSFIPVNSTLILFSSIALVLAAFFLSFNDIEISKLRKWLSFSIVFISLFCLNMIINPNSYILTYGQNFIMYAVFPILLLTKVKDYQMVIKIFGYFSVVAGLVLVLDPLIDYRFTQNYMVYGYTLFMYALLGMAGLYYLFQKNIVLPLYLFVLLFIGIWGNKGAFLAGLLLLFMVLYSRLKVIGKVLFMAFTTYALFSYDSILLYVINLLEKLGIQTYSLVTFQRLLGNESDTVTSLRTDIWEQAQAFQSQHLLGGGIGGFELEYGYYTHNVFLDMLVTFGYFGTLLFLIMFMLSLVMMMRTKNVSLKICQFGCLLAWFIPMQISLTFWNVSLFWIYFALVFLPNPKERFSDNSNFSGMMVK